MPAIHPAGSATLGGEPTQREDRGRRRHRSDRKLSFRTHRENAGTQCRCNTERNNGDRNGLDQGFGNGIPIAKGAYE